MTKVKFVKRSETAIEPSRADIGSNGFDLYASKDVVIPGYGTQLVPTDISIELPKHDGEWTWLAYVLPRSGLALKHGLTVLNSAGLVDNSYRGPIGVIIHNTLGKDYTVTAGDRIAQLVIMKQPLVELREVLVLDETERGEGGFGSSGK